MVLFQSFVFLELIYHPKYGQNAGNNIEEWRICDIWDAQSNGVDTDIIGADDSGCDDGGWLDEEACDTAGDSGSDGSNDDCLRCKCSALEINCGEEYEYTHDERDANFFGRECDERQEKTS